MRYYNGINHMQNYEISRLTAFHNAERGYHSNEDFRTAYLAWSEAPPLPANSSGMLTAISEMAMPLAPIQRSEKAISSNHDSLMSRVILRVSHEN